jgi:hypothetical protein
MRMCCQTCSRTRRRPLRRCSPAQGQDEDVGEHSPYTLHLRHCITERVAPDYPLDAPVTARYNVRGAGRG